MKITEVRTTHLAKPIENPVSDSTLLQTVRDIILVEIRTDDGLTGIGFITGLGAVNGSEGPVLKFCIDKTLAPLLIGRDPLAREQLWEEMFRRTTRFGRKGAMIKALSAVDIALWDLAGKYANMPVYKLIGYNNDKVRVYASGGYYNPNNPMDISETVETIHSYVEAGYPAIKMKVGGLPVRQDIARVTKIREAVGDSIQIMVDANQNWNLLDAVRFCDAVRDLDIGFVEEPLPPDDFDGYAELARRTNIPLAAGETENTKYGFVDLIKRCGVRVLNNDVTRTGGVTEWRKATTLAQCWNLPVIPHGIQEIHVSLCATAPNCPMTEYFMPDHPIQQFISEFFVEVAPGMKVIDGCIRPLDVPGLALGYDTDLYKKYTVSTEIIR